MRIWREHAAISRGFTRTFGIIFVATLSVFLVSTEATAEELTAAFTILGTLAGYIAGAKPEGTTTTTTGSGASAETVVVE
jgi:hypothetical protein